MQTHELLGPGGQPIPQVMPVFCRYRNMRIGPHKFLKDGVEKVVGFLVQLPEIGAEVVVDGPKNMTLFMESAMAIYEEAKSDAAKGIAVAAVKSDGSPR